MKRTLWIAGVIAWAGAVCAAQAGGDVEAGRAKAGPCAGCHGQNGEGNSSSPALAGMAADQFVQAMSDFKSGKRKNAAMKAFASKLNDQDAANLAAYYASLKGK